MRRTDSYQALLSEGDRIVPDLIRFLPHSRSPMAVLLLLTEITGEGPPPVKAPKLERIGWEVRNVRLQIDWWLEQGVT